MRYEESEGGGKQHGTKLILSGLLERENWQDEEHVLELQRKLSGMIFPFEEAKDFRVRLEVDGKKLELAEIAKKSARDFPREVRVRVRWQSLESIGRCAAQVLPAEGQGG